MYASTLRQSLATFNARLGKQAQTLPAAARRSGGDALRPGYNNFSSSLRNRTARAMTTMTAAMMMRGLWTSSRAIGVTPLSVRVGSNSQRASSGSVRWNSGKGEPSWRQWGFEDVCFFFFFFCFTSPPFHFHGIKLTGKIQQINASLPSETAGSPPQTPQKNLILVDVREPAELTSTGIIPTAVAVPLASQPDALFLTPEEFETRLGYPKPGAGEDDAGDVVF